MLVERSSIGQKRFPRMKNECPECGSVIYSRRNILCGVCGERLPEELLFTNEEREAVERELEELKQREREERRRAGEWSGSDVSGGDYV